MVSNTQNSKKTIPRATSGFSFLPKTITSVYIYGILLRLFMLWLGEYLDKNSPLSYTDIDYNVFTDAARYLYQNKSPYERSTYRYTPILALILTPNHWLHFSFGKYVFSFCDLLVAYFIQKFLEMRAIPEHDTIKYVSFWLLNPIVANIPTRGSAESIVNAVVFLTFYLIATKKLFAASIAFGVAVHIKIYPIIYALPILLVLTNNYYDPAPKHTFLNQRMYPLWKKNLSFLRSQAQDQKHKYLAKNNDSNSNNNSNGNNQSSTSILQAIISKKLSNLINSNRIVFTILSGSTFLLLNFSMYYIYGSEFVHHTYLYHVIRKDHRHNFSIWFLSIYANFNAKSTMVFGLLSFLPQILVVFLIGLIYGPDLLFAAFCQTFAFVAFNKVCTAQYFMWYFCFIPVIVPFSRISFKKSGVWLCLAWILAQVLYLYYGNLLENVGLNVFLNVWYAGIVVFVVNVYILATIIKNQTFSPLLAPRSKTL